MLAVLACVGRLCRPRRAGSLQPAADLRQVKIGVVIQELEVGDVFWHLASSGMHVPVIFARMGVCWCHDRGELNQSSENCSFCAQAFFDCLQNDG